jgi:hypothetical protein
MSSSNKRIAKSGRIYYTKSKDYVRGEKKNDYPPFMHSTTDPYYLAYFQKKTAIRSEYPFWHKMSSEQWRDYYERIYRLMQTDADYQHWIKEVNASIKQNINWEVIDRNIQRSKDYPNGFSHDM